MHIFRLMLTVPAAIAGWYIGVVVALLLHRAGQWLCPSGQVVSGTCLTPWASFVSDASLALGSLVCGALTVLLPTLVAPCHRIKVALLAYVSGLACSAYWLLHGHWLPVSLAALAGAVTLWRIKAVLVDRPCTNSNEKV